MSVNFKTHHSLSYFATCMREKGLIRRFYILTLNGGIQAKGMGVYSYPSFVHIHVPLKVYKLN